MLFGPKVPGISVEQLKEKLDRKENIFILDVRDPDEYKISGLPGSKLIPLAELPQRFKELDPSLQIVVHCKAGGRSAKAVQFLRQQGFKNAVNLDGGLNAWAKRIDPAQ
ncbi:MAG: rhodanese-like domain-containing protein [Elusimicrobiota bacterium]